MILKTVLIAALTFSPLQLVEGRRSLNQLRPQSARHSQKKSILSRSTESQATLNGTDATTNDYRYYNDKTSKFFVESLPEFPKLSEMYAGLIPIDPAVNASRDLFFIFQPSTGKPVDEITIWLNGGPGCTSMEGFLQENGEFVWLPGTMGPQRNPWAWTNETNMLWVDQPVGVGFSAGTPTASTEEEIAQDFIKWFKNFQEAFGICDYHTFVTGESYAGRYVSYISLAMLEQEDKKYYDLQGALIFDGTIGAWETQQEEIPLFPFVAANNNVFNLNDTFMAQLESLHKQCGYADYLDKYLTFPASGIQPPSFINFSDPAALECDIFDIAYSEVQVANSCFNIYHITDFCPPLYDPMAFSLDEANAPSYFNRTDVKKALHVPLDTNFENCVLGVFVGGGGTGGPQSEGDLSADPIQAVLPKVIDATQRVLIANGNLDGIILTNGTLLAIQNMTWGGQLGFQNAPNTTFEVTLGDIEYGQFLEAQGFTDFTQIPQGKVGLQHSERGLLYVEVFQSGHMQPEYMPRAAFEQLLWLLRRIDSLPSSPP
ncbi:Alpha/Beta hydrolase protein [Naematelia encephala]|uniref:Carboxypeptidase n=1 Tax=Naematelia encephala TaxID=71784 RepID=A0A1Y2AXP5_9TREE|nr:Alpha/Beta hydrolase protein [Naematelia encephala]